MIQIKDIKYKKETTYMGRNGMGRQIGVGLSLDPYCLLIEPINSKNHIANCQIRIPRKDLINVMDQLIIMLKNELNELDKLGLKKPTRIEYLKPHKD